MTAVEEYLEARHRYDVLASSIAALRQRFLDTAEALRFADHAYVSNVEVPYPRRLLQKGVEILGAAEFPSMKEIGTMISDYQITKGNLRKTYDAVAAPHRKGLKAPPDQV